MVHGLGGAAVNWLGVGPEFAKNHRTFALDLAGFGRTPLFHRSATLGAHAELVHRFIDEVIGEPVILIGNSMGGHIAILVAADHPQSVSRLILVDPAVPGEHVRRADPASLGVVAALSLPGLVEMVIDRRARNLGPEGLVMRTINLVMADPSRVDGELLEAHVQLIRERSFLGRQNSRAFTQAIRSLGLRMADPRFWARMKKVVAPTLVIHGELDRLIPVSAARDLIRRRPEWTLEIFKGVGHVPMMEAPDRFMEVVNEWLTYKIAPEPAKVS
jgi:pimeloyl-ACP methyl ester carboxylesterase